uniref:Uncharacterized protein n=1 Tax=Physcomitrium patens TaxID=3218 RepID=A0A2K1J2W5_PHYPA|nr:hypothetical protein PHYPA_021714 [Physcomitrium patens]
MKSLDIIQAKLGAHTSTVLIDALANLEQLMKPAVFFNGVNNLRCSPNVVTYATPSMGLQRLVD